MKTFGKRTTGVANSILPRPTVQAAPLQSVQPRAPQGGTAAQDINSVAGRARNTLRNALFKELLDVVDLAELARLPPEKARSEVEEVIRTLLQQHQNSLDLNEQESIVVEISNDVLGLGPLEQLLSRDDISDIMVCGPHRVFIEVGGRIQLTDIKFRDEGQLINICRRIVSAVGRRVDESSPICDARLADGSRVAIIVPPLSPDGTTLTIRKFRREKLSLQELVRFGSLSRSAARLIEVISACRCNVLISGGTGSGKAQPLSSGILTPTGWKTMGDMHVGSIVTAADGRSSRVNGVFPQGTKEIFKVSFEDGRTVPCCDDHLWKVWTRVEKWCPERKKKVRTMGWQVVSLKEIRGWFARGGNAAAYAAVPLMEPFSAGLPAGGATIPAYALGVLLGDDNTSNDIMDMIELSMPHLNLDWVTGDVHDCGVVMKTHARVGLLCQELKRLGLNGLKAHEKFVPNAYKYGSIEERTFVLQGLMATNGWVQATTARFASTSLRLALDVQEIAWSLGAIAHIRPGNPEDHLDKGQKLETRPFWIVSIRHPEHDVLFGCLGKKPASTCRQANLRLRMTGIESIGFQPAQCISIDHPSHLYVTDGYVVTHNTTLLNCVTRFIDPGERIITIEDAMELQLQQPHVVRWETRPPNLEGVGEITMSNLVKAALRHRPERIIIGEVRGKEAFDLLQAMNTGHDGSAGTVHSNSPREAISRLESMIAMGGWGLPARQVREQIVGSLDVIIQATRLRDGSRRVTHITEVVGMEGETPTLQDLMVFEQQGEDANGKIIGIHKMTGMRPHMFDKARGYMLDRELMSAMQDQVKD